MCYVKEREKRGLTGSSQSMFSIKASSLSGVYSAGPCSGVAGATGALTAATVTSASVIVVEVRDSDILNDLQVFMGLARYGNAIKMVDGKIRTYQQHTFLYPSCC